MVGPSGSGKTMLLQTIAGKHHYTGGIQVARMNANAQAQKMVLVEQQHRFRNLSNTSNFYYQQRFNSCDSEDAITVEEDLNNHIANRMVGNNYQKEVEEVVELLKLRKLLPVRLIQLSNGENKRVQVAKALLLKPTILLLDNPFTGLDVEARSILCGQLDTICREGIQIILVASQQLLPAFITHVVSLKKDGSAQATDRGTFLRNNSAFVHTSEFEPNSSLLSAVFPPSGILRFDVAVKMTGVSVQYNHREILDNVSWQVGNGDRWSLSGPNGSGKSTLLSLINGDNPQAYANEIYLFDKRRGTGETIWDVKKRIGYVSPELHLYFDTSVVCSEIVASGLFDTIGLFRLLNEVQRELVSNCMKLLGIYHLANKLLYQLSNSEQRLVLLARALVKDPPLLLLDEPCQGLDENQVELFKSIINGICRVTGKTLVYVSHYTHEIPACVNKFLKLENGRVV
ncbi:MAG: ATP-binding cassette domain-containing protein [Chitinophagaceae bacterium]